jgi:ribosomal protein S18 acetylase RimI-like enzyme
MNTPRIRAYAIQELSPGEIQRIAEIDVSETGDVVYKWVGSVVQPAPERWERGPRDWSGYIPDIQKVLGQGGAAIAAIADDRVVGVCVLRDRLADGVAELAGLWVDCHHRRMGIARALAERAIARGRDTGARSVYVSATPSVSAYGFYTSLGFRPAIFVHRELFLREPEDIHMLLDLERPAGRPSRVAPVRHR